ncbi:MAG: putative porin [Prevotella sp.]|nr:putative porin [Prevotella sp.]
MRRLHTLLLLTLFTGVLLAQNYNSIDPDGNIRPASNRQHADSTKGEKEIPIGLKVWTVDERFGDITPTEPDTMAFMYMNTIFTSGLHGEYNTTGNLGAPRQNRIFTDRDESNEFIFANPLDHFITSPGLFHFTNTYSPITNLSLNSCGNRTNGEDHFKALFAINAGKRLGMGLKFDYLYGRGYYSDNSSSHFNYSIYGSYLGDRYQAHFLFGTNHQKQAENGGITNDNYITHPESFNDDYQEAEIPTMLSDNWNRNDNLHVFFTHRYSVGFNRKVPMTEEEIKARKFAMEARKENNARNAKEEARREAEKDGGTFDEEEYDRQLKMAANIPNADSEATPEDTTWTKNEYVPVTSFIHTARLDKFTRIYQSYYTPADYYGDTYNTWSRFSGDSIYDRTEHYELRNTFAVALLEGFNKYAKAGLKAFVTHSLMHFTLPDSTTRSRSYNENDFFVGGQLSKTDGETLHYNVTGEVEVAGNRIGDVNIDGEADLNFHLWGDTIQLAANGFFHLNDPTFYHEHYHSKHFWWDNDDLDKITHTKIQGTFSLQRTGTHLRVAVDNLSNYTYFGTSYDVENSGDNYFRLHNKAGVRQCSENISVLTATLGQQLRFGIVNLDAELTYQKSSKDDIIPVPAFNAYANLFLRFKIAHVLDCDLGADVRYFTKYHAPDYVPGIGQYAIQETPSSRVDIGNIAVANVYANFFLKHTRFFVMLSHVNHSGEGGNYFLTPHYPINERLFRFGLSWNFFN